MIAKPHFHAITETVSSDGRCIDRKSKRGYVTRGLAARTEPDAYTAESCFTTKCKVFAIPQLRAIGINAG